MTDEQIQDVIFGYASQCRQAAETAKNRQERTNQEQREIAAYQIYALLRQAQ